MHYHDITPPAGSVLASINQVAILAVLLGYDESDTKNGFDPIADVNATGVSPTVGLMSKVMEIGRAGDFIGDLKQLQKQELIEIYQTNLGVTARATDLGRNLIDKWQQQLPKLYTFPGQHLWLEVK